jgi:uncharacterized membrane protein SirB2
MYNTLKWVHVGAAILTICGFVLRGYWMMIKSPKLQQRWVRILPHLLDTVLLLAGISLVMTLNLQVMQNPWLIMKISALIVYILLGTIALKRGKTRSIRTSALVLAMMTFAYIAGVALSKSMTSWLAY